MKTKTFIAIVLGILLVAGAALATPIGWQFWMGWTNALQLQAQLAPGGYLYPGAMAGNIQALDWTFLKTTNVADDTKLAIQMHTLNGTILPANATNANAIVAGVTSGGTYKNCLLAPANRPPGTKCPIFAIAGLPGNPGGENLCMNYRATDYSGYPVATNACSSGVSGNTGAQIRPGILAGPGITYFEQGTSAQANASSLLAKANAGLDWLFVDEPWGPAMDSPYECGPGTINPNEMCTGLETGPGLSHDPRWACCTSGPPAPGNSCASGSGGLYGGGCGTCTSQVFCSGSGVFANGANTGIASCCVSAGVGKTGTGACPAELPPSVNHGADQCIADMFNPLFAYWKSVRSSGKVGIVMSFEQFHPMTVAAGLKEDFQGVEGYGGITNATIPTVTSSGYPVWFFLAGPYPFCQAISTTTGFSNAAQVALWDTDNYQVEITVPYSNVINSQCTGNGTDVWGPILYPPPAPEPDVPCCKANTGGCCGHQDTLAGVVQTYPNPNDQYACPWNNTTSDPNPYGGNDPSLGKSTANGPDCNYPNFIASLAQSNNGNITTTTPPSCQIGNVNELGICTGNGGSYFGCKLTLSPPPVAGQQCQSGTFTATCGGIDVLTCTYVSPNMLNCSLSVNGGPKTAVGTCITNVPFTSGAVNRVSDLCASATAPTGFAGYADAYLPITSSCANNLAPMAIWTPTP